MYYTKLFAFCKSELILFLINKSLSQRDVQKKTKWQILGKKIAQWLKKSEMRQKRFEAEKAANYAIFNLYRSFIVETYFELTTQV